MRNKQKKHISFQGREKKGDPSKNKKHMGDCKIPKT